MNKILAISLAIACSFQISAIAKPVKSQQLKSFARWCQEKNSVSAETRKTIDALLLTAKTNNCKLADRQLKSLQAIRFSGEGISDLQPLASFTNLIVLSIRQNKVIDLRPLTNLRNLEELYFDDNQIVDLKPIARLQKLKTISMHDNQIVDLQPLAGLKNLTILGLSRNQISDVQPLAKLTNLETLVIGENQINDVQLLSKLTKLTNFYAQNNPLTDRTCPVQPASVCHFTE